MRKFIFIGCAFGWSVEFLFKFVAALRPAGFAIAFVFYPLYLVFVFFTAKLFRRISNPITATIAYYFFYGFLGLMIEWQALGNSPSANPQAGQITMFSMWASFAMMPLIFTDEDSDTARLRAFIRISLCIYLAISLIGAFFPQPLRFLWVIYLASFFYIGWNGVYLWYLLILRRRDPPGRARSTLPSVGGAR